MNTTPHYRPIWLLIACLMAGCGQGSLVTTTLEALTSPNVLSQTTPTSKRISCQRSGPVERLENAEDVDTLAETVLAYLNSGGSSTGLVAALAQAQILAAVHAVDFDGDQIDELVLTADFPKPGPPHTFLIWSFKCHDGLFRLVGRHLESPYVSSVDRLLLEDLTGDALPELVLQWNFNSSGGLCEVSLSALGWSNDGITDLFVATERPHCPGNVALEDRNNDGVKETLILSGYNHPRFQSGQPHEVIHFYVLRNGRFEIETPTASPGPR